MNKNITLKALKISAQMTLLNVAMATLSAVISHILPFTYEAVIVPVNIAVASAVLSRKRSMTRTQTFFGLCTAFLLGIVSVMVYPSFAIPDILTFSAVWAYFTQTAGYIFLMFLRVYRNVDVKYEYGSSLYHISYFCKNNKRIIRISTADKPVPGETFTGTCCNRPHQVETVAKGHGIAPK